jgi:hypothetical protein
MNNSVEQPVTPAENAALRSDDAKKSTKKESHHHPVVQTGRIRKM